MAAQKGHKKLGGRVKGTPNKSTKDIREAYQMLIERNIPKLEKWLDAISKKSPERAIYILYNLSEYVIPKLNRTDLTTGDKPLQFKLPDINIYSKNDTDGK